MAFCFGQEAETGLKAATQGDAAFKDRIFWLYHPSAIERAQRHGKTPQQWVDSNDDDIERALRLLL